MGDHQQQQQRMNNNTNSSSLELPPGFRFHPSDEEIITFYLRPKVLDDRFTAHAIGEADINTCEPWELPGMAKMGEKEWYFYCLKGRKYPSGFRANRATKAGYWKATGKDREIYQATSKRPVLVGMKKTLVFYKGRAPTGAKTEWVMHEFRLDGSGSLPCPTVRPSSSTTVAMKSSSKEEWMICRIYHKNSGVKKASTSSFDIATVVGDVEHMSMSFPLPMQFPMGLGDFTINPNSLHPILDPSVSFYPTTCISTTIPPMVGMGNYGLQMDTSHFRDPIANAQSLLYQQMEIGPSEDGGTMDGQRTLSPQPTNGVDISSMVSACLTSVTTIDTDDGTWKF